MAVHGLRKNGGKLALATMYVGVGQGISIALECVSLNKDEEECR
jgi:acetyl-CoA acetyltransferase